ncbi:MAG: type II toxin-antitoxin system RelE/ParE family toxin [Chlorobium sp.]|nr:type II toxin-antitoxin system RelE/ParE family toxin [Chlorobium sp.]
MLKSFRDRWLETFFIDGTKNKKISAIIRERLFRTLQIVDDSTCNADLRSPPSNNYEKLAGTHPPRLFVYQG